MTSEKRANSKFMAGCDAGAIDAYMSSQMTSGRLNNAQRAEMAASGMGGGLMGSLRSTGCYSTGAVNDEGHKTMRSTGGSSGFGGASLLASLRSPGGGGGGGSPSGGESYDVRGEIPSGRSQSRHELLMAITQMERSLGDERRELSRLRGEVGRHATVMRGSPKRRIHLNMYHHSTGAC